LTRHPPTRFKHAFEIGATRKTAAVNDGSVPQLSRDFAPERSANRRCRLLSSAAASDGAGQPPARRHSPLEANMSAGEFVTGVGGTGDLVAGDLPGCLRRATIGLLALLAAAIVFVAPAVAVPRPNPLLNSTDAMLKWINAYRAKPEPHGLPILVRALSQRQAFKDAETSGAYIGFIAGVLGANPDRAAELIAKMPPIAPADHWVLVRAIAYSELPNWKALLATFVDRMPTRRAMIDKYLDGKLPTLDQIDYQPAKPGMLDKSRMS
jgi:hypothetical protein